MDSSSKIKIRSRSRNFDGGLVVVLLMALAMVDRNGVVVGQQIPACASKLLPCSDYLNSTSPPDSCCNPLREAVRDDLKCLCNLYSNRQMFNSLGINITQVLQLPKHCGIIANLTSCSAQATPPSVANSTPSTPSASGGSGSSNGATGVAWIGMSCWMAVLLSWASLTR